MTKVDIFSGFLGAGKTMLIKKLLSENAYGKNTVIIENEFGEVGIDGEILRETNINIKEISAKGFRNFKNLTIFCAYDMTLIKTLCNYVE